MNLSSQAISLLSVAFFSAGVAALAVVSRRADRERKEQAPPSEKSDDNLSGAKAIAVDCVKKPVPIFTVYQY